MDELDGFDDIDLLDGAIDQTYTGKVPSGLMALCILTFVGSGVILIKDFFTYSFYSLANSLNDNVFNKTGHHELDAFFGALPLIYITETISCLMAVAGAIMMIRMNLKGFYIYIVSTVLYSLGIFWFWFSVPELQIDEGFIMLMLLYLAAPIGFVIMYGANRKYMS